MATIIYHEKFDEDIGCIVRQCIECGEWWPKDREFFFTSDNKGHLMPRCKACYTEKFKPRMGLKHLRSAWEKYL